MPDTLTLNTTQQDYFSPCTFVGASTPDHLDSAAPVFAELGDGNASWAFAVRLTTPALPTPTRQRSRPATTWRTRP